MKNFVAHGNAITIVAAAALSSGDPVLVGSVFGVAAGDIANGDSGVINLTGIYNLPKAPSQAWSVGDAIYWDAGNGRTTSTALNNTLVGVATAAVAGGAGDLVGQVRLNGSFGHPVGA